MSETGENELVFLPLGGVGEIGMNLALYGFGSEDDREWLIVDMGVSFAGEELPGADLILPDIRFLESERHNLRGLVLTHAHEDHYGGVLDLWPQLKIPVYCTAFTAALLESKRKSDFKNAAPIPVHIFQAGESFQLGPFEIEAIAVSHSIPDPVALAIRTPLGLVIHTGDWKIDPAPVLGHQTDGARLRALGEEGVLALVCDSTNAMVEGVSPTETAVSDSLAQIIAESPARVAITSFASNVGRVRSIAIAASQIGRHVTLIGRSMKRAALVAHELGLLPEWENFLSEEESASLARNKIVYILTGSQGEPRAALAKLAREEMRGLALDEGDVVIYSSRPIPGNEKSILGTQNLLVDRGIKIITERDRLVHVSGHPRRCELKQIYDWLKPEILVPVHGESLHLTAHAEFGRQCGIKTVASIRNGLMLKLAPEGGDVIDEVPFGRLYKDGQLVGSEDELGIRERRKLSQVGHVAASLVLDRQHELAAEIELVAFGVPESDGRGKLVEDILIERIEEAILSIPRQKRKDDELVREAARRAIRACINGIWGKKPVTSIFLSRPAR